MEPSPESSQSNSRLTPAGSTTFAQNQSDYCARQSSSQTTSRSRDTPPEQQQQQHKTDHVATPQNQVPNAKVAIPRNHAGSSVRYSRRVAKACESCRQRKTKCSGDTPVCRQCRELRVKCQYPDGMREKTKRYVYAMSAVFFSIGSFKRRSVANWLLCSML